MQMKTKRDANQPAVGVHDIV